MKKTLSICFLSLLSVGFSFIFGQNCQDSRYLNRAFASIDTLIDVVFGTAPAITAVYVSEFTTTNQDLKMDIYTPVGDTLSQRPCFVFAFGGGFLIGEKEDEDARSLCDSMARKGYVAASIQYRKNMNISNSGSGERAVYRGAQDYSAAIRFLKEYADSFRIDTNFIFAGGVSAGSFSAMHMSYMEDAERPQATYSGNVLIPGPDLGCLDCSGNNFAHSNKVKAIVNCWGALADTSYIDPDEPPLISFHGDIDAIVPYNEGFPFTALFTMPTVQGSNLITDRANHIGLQNTFVPFPGEGHNIWGTVALTNFVGGPSQYWEPIIDSISVFLFDFLKPITSPISGSGLVNQGNVISYSVVGSPGYWYCWEVDGGEVVSANPNLNTVDVRWDSLGLGRVWVTEFTHLRASGDRVEKEVVVLSASSRAHAEVFPGLKIFPNPASDHVQVIGAPEGSELRISDPAGREVLGAEIRQHEQSLEVGGLAPGIYLLEIHHGKKSVWHKWVME